MLPLSRPNVKELPLVVRFTEVDLIECALGSMQSVEASIV